METPHGIEVLPLELANLVLIWLSAQDLRSARLVNRNWEDLTRPFFAAKHLSRSVFWLTSSSLSDLEQLSQKFGPWMRTIYITTDRFTIFGLIRLFRQYWHDSRTVFTRSRYDNKLDCTVYTRYTILDIKVPHLRKYFMAKGWHCPVGSHANARFFGCYICNIFSQTWLRLSSGDTRALTRLACQIPQCEIKVVTLSYEIGQLSDNSQQYGKPAPEHAYELALYSRETASDKYKTYVAWVVDEALQRRKRRLGYKAARKVGG